MHAMTTWLKAASMVCSADLQCMSTIFLVALMLRRSKPRTYEPTHSLQHIVSPSLTSAYAHVKAQEHTYTGIHLHMKRSAVQMDTVSRQVSVLIHKSNAAHPVCSGSDQGQAGGSCTEVADKCAQGAALCRRLLCRGPGQD